MTPKRIVGGLLAAALVCPLPAAGTPSSWQKPATQSNPELDRADALQDQVRALRAARKFDEALEAARASLEIRERVLGPGHADVAVSLNLIGFLSFSLRNYTEAEPAFLRALRIRRTAAEVEPAEISESLNNLASLYQEQGRLREVEPLLVESLAILVRSKAPDATLAGAYNNLGGLMYRRGDYARARDHFRRAADLWARAKGPEDAAVGTALNNLGLAWQDLGDFVQAETSLRKSVAIREKAGDSPELAKGLQNLAQALHEQGRLADAEPLYVRAISMFEKLGRSETPESGQAMNNLAILYLLEKDPGRAGPLYERALKIRETALGPQHPDVATSLLSYAIYLHSRDRIAEAVDVYARGTEIIERNVALVLEVGSERQKERYLKLFADSIDVTLWLRSRAQSAAADRTAVMTLLRRKGRIQEVLAASTDALRATGGRGTADLDALATSRAALARLVLQAPGAADQRAIAIKALEDRVEGLEARVSATGADRNAARGVTAEALQGRIPEGAVLVEFFKYRPFDPAATRVTDRFGPARYVAFALKRTGPSQWLELGDAAAIDAGIAALRGALLNPRRADVIDRARALAPLLTDPLTSLVGNAEEVFLAPDGDLNLLPFQALVGADGRFLVERTVFTYLTSGRDLLPGPSPPQHGRPLIVANPAFGVAAGATGPVSRSFTALPGAAAEARAIQSLLPGARMLTGALATEAAVKATHGPAVLHIATHGFFLAGTSRDAVAGTRGLRPVSAPAATSISPLLRSGLALAGANVRKSRNMEDGILTASEAAMLDLKGTELVFLSSCESGLGVVNAGESVYGLRRAFVIAGARSQVLTLWQVSDAATRTFVVEFYQRLQAGTGRSAALRDAQRQALADPARRHPFYWAPFILSGEGGPLTVR